MQPAQPSDPTGLETLEYFSGMSAFNRWLYEKIKGFVQGRVLEIGSGIGNISDFLLADQTDVSLSDLRPEYCRLLEAKFSHHSHLSGIFELDLSTPDFENSHPDLLSSFDTVIALNVIEHIEDDVMAVKNAKSLLRHNGRLIVLVPNGKWLYNRLDQELGHFNRYSKKELNLRMVSAGLTVTDSQYFNAGAIPGWWFSGKILRDRVISEKKLHIYNKLVPVFRILDFFVSPFTGISVISTATKT